MAKAKKEKYAQKKNKNEGNPELLLDCTLYLTTVRWNKQNISKQLSFAWTNKNNNLVAYKIKNKISSSNSTHYISLAVIQEITFLLQKKELKTEILLKQNPPAVQGNEEFVVTIEFTEDIYGAFLSTLAEVRGFKKLSLFPIGLDTLQLVGQIPKYNKHTETESKIKALVYVDFVKPKPLIQSPVFKKYVPTTRKPKESNIQKIYKQKIKPSL